MKWPPYYFGRAHQILVPNYLSLLKSLSTSITIGVTPREINECHFVFRLLILMYNYC